LTTSTHAAARRRSALTITFRTPVYRAATIAMFLSGLGTSAAAPQIASFLVYHLGASYSTAGLYYLTNLTAPVAGYLIGSRSDRTGRRMGLFRICAILGFAGWVGIAFSTKVWMPFVISALVLAFAGAAGSQLFAALHDDLAAAECQAADGVIAIVRMALTGGWVVGPVCGAFLAATAGLRTMLFATALCLGGQAVPLIGQHFQEPRSTSPGEGRSDTPRVGLKAMLPLLTFSGLYICVYAGESVKYAFLPIYLNQQLRLNPAVSGAVIGIQPLVELVLMPLSILVANRIGAIRLMVVGAGFGVAANILFATTASAAGMFAGQILMGGVWGVFAALGIIVAQRLLPQAVATAAAIFMNCTAVASAIGGITGGLGAATIGIPHVFLVPAGFAAVATVGLVVMSRTVPEHRREPEASDPRPRGCGTP